MHLKGTRSGTRSCTLRMRSVSSSRPQQGALNSTARVVWLWQRCARPDTSVERSSNSWNSTSFRSTVRYQRNFGEGGGVVTSKCGCSGKHESVMPVVRSRATHCGVSRQAPLKLKPFRFLNAQRKHKKIMTSFSVFCKLPNPRYL